MIAAVLLHVFTGGYVVMNGIAYSLGGNIFTTYYISLSIFLAYAVTYPDLQLLLMFVIPIRMKWMAFVYGLFIAWDIVSYLRVGLWVGVVPIVASLLNFVIFYFSTRDMNRYNPKEIHRRQQFKKAVAPSRTGFGRMGSPSINVRSADVPKRMTQTWSFVSAQSATEIMNIVRIIYLHINTYSKTHKRRRTLL